MNFEFMTIDTPLRLYAISRALTGFQSAARKGHVLRMLDAILSKGQEDETESCLSASVTAIAAVRPQP